MSFAIGENVGPYRIVEQLGSGGMATVYKAYHAALDRYVAIKVLHPAFKEDPNFLTRFQREARIVAKLEHPNIVPVYDFSEASGQPYLVMRYIEGETLKARLAKGRLPLNEVARIMRPVGSALTYAHGQGVLHRDVKPSNILLTPDGGVFLADFGLARIAQAGESTLSQDALLGTPQYISPEQAKGSPDLDVRTDVYSLAVVMYELLVGRVPYQADTPYAVIHDHIYAPLPLPRSIKPDFPEPLERVLLKALSKECDDRYASIAELMAAFDRAVGEVSASTRISPPESMGSAVAVSSSTPTTTTVDAPALATASSSRTKVWIGIGAVVAVVAMIALAVWLTRPARQPLPPPQATSQPAAQPSIPQPAVDRIQPQIDRFRNQFELANGAIAQGQIERARQMMTQVGQEAEDLLGSAPDLNRDQRLQLDTLAGESWLAANAPERAQPHLETLAEMILDKPEPAIGLGVAQLMQGHFTEAEAALNRALQIDSNSASAHAVKACLLLKQNEPVMAVREFRLATSAGSDAAKLLFAPWIRLVLSDLDCGENRFRP